jgi:hypothetical protein
MMAAEEVADVRDRRAQRTGVTYGTATCVQNSRIILGKYLNVKLTAHIIRAGASHTGGAGRASRDVQTPLPTCRAFPASLARLA